ALMAKYTGPKKFMAWGMAAVIKNKKPRGPAAKKAAAKKAAEKKGPSTKKKNGPRPSRPAGNLMDSEGFAPIKRKK
ncbi:MAG: ATP-dependent helicase, partial [Pseudomonadota bacterium]|nr:ATP-dependent helicase [Pseudomonadota bacterium]